MDISGIGSGATAASSAQLSDQMGIAVLKKSLDAQQAVALQLIQSIQAPQPSHLGQNVDLVA